MEFNIRKIDPFFLILLLGLLVRIYAFGTVPSGVNQDELSTGYDAWSVLHYSIDRNGFRLPMMFVSWLLLQVGRILSLLNLRID
ncbi:MAG: hypothetical protein O3A80_04460 [bacterium]|nr:hypothetical protein [bacterium]